MTKIIPQDIVNPLPTLKASHVFVRVFTNIRLLPLGLAIIFGLIGIWVVSLILLLIAIGLAIKAARKSLDEKTMQIIAEANKINSEIDSHNRSIAKVSSELDAINLKAWDYFNDLSMKLEETEQSYEELKRLLENKIAVRFWELLDDAYSKFNEFNNILSKIVECQEEFQLGIDDYHQNVTKINQYDKKLSIRISSYQPRVIPDPENFILDDQEFPDAITPYDDFQKIHDEAMINTKFQRAYMRWEDHLREEARHQDKLAAQDAIARRKEQQDREISRSLQKIEERKARAAEREARAAEEAAEAAAREAVAAERGATAAQESADTAKKELKRKEELDKKYGR